MALQYKSQLLPSLASVRPHLSEILLVNISSDVRLEVRADSQVLLQKVFSRFYLRQDRGRDHERILYLHQNATHIPAPMLAQIERKTESHMSDTTEKQTTRTASSHTPVGQSRVCKFLW